MLHKLLKRHSQNLSSLKFTLNESLVEKPQNFTGPVCGQLCHRPTAHPQSGAKPSPLLLETPFRTKEKT